MKKYFCFALALILLSQINLHASGVMQTERQPRLYILLFTLSELSPDIEQGIDLLFDKVLRKNDQLLIMANSIAIREHTLLDPEKEKKQLNNMLQKVSAASKKNLEKMTKDLENHFENAIHDTTTIEVTAAEHSEDLPANLRRCKIKFEDFFKYLDQYQQTLLLPNVRSLPGLMRDVQHREAEKWVIHFFQFNHYPDISINARIKNNIARIIRDSKSFPLGECASAAVELESVLGDHYHEIEEGMVLPTASISSLFNSSRFTYIPILFNQRSKINSKNKSYQKAMLSLKEDLTWIAEENRGELIFVSDPEVDLQRMTEIASFKVSFY